MVCCAVAGAGLGTVEQRCTAHVHSQSPSSRSDCSESLAGAGTGHRSDRSRPGPRYGIETAGGGRQSSCAPAARRRSSRSGVAADRVVRRARRVVHRIHRDVRVQHRRRPHRSPFLGVVPCFHTREEENLSNRGTFSLPRPVSTCQ